MFANHDEQAKWAVDWNFINRDSEKYQGGQIWISKVTKYNTCCV